MGLVVLACGLTCAGLMLLVLDLTNLDSSLSLRQFAQMSPFLFLCGRAHIGFALPSVGYTRIGSSLPLQSMAKMGLAAFLSDFSHGEPSIFLRNSG